MILIDTALEAREREGRPVRVGVYGAGAMAAAFIDQVTTAVPGMRIAAVCNRTADRAMAACRDAGIADVATTDSVAALEDVVARGGTAVTDDPTLLTRSEQIDCLVDITGAIDYGAAIALDAIECRKHLVLMNAEIDATIGALLRRKADAAGIILTAADGDQPGVQLNLWRYVKGMGMTPRVLGNIKGLQDPYRTPTTQAAFAARWKQTPKMVTSFADGSKVNVEQAVVANATGFHVPKRGMYQYRHDGHVNDMTTMYDVDQLREWGGIVDYVVGAAPAPGVYCIAERAEPLHRHLLELYKLGEGPCTASTTRITWCTSRCTTPWLAWCCSATRAARRCPSRRSRWSRSRRDLLAGEVLDGYGEYMTYGEAENVPEVRAAGLVPEGLVEGCRLLADMSRRTSRSTGRRSRRPATRWHTGCTAR
ncbi:MAG: hypothetical protein R2713_06995 [Ilumatobacteraceae bacterium]